MKSVIFTGAGTALVTPMKQDGSVDFTRLGQLIDNQIEAGIDALIICGTTGESAALSECEHISCVEYAVRRAAGRVPVIAGAGSNNTAKAVRLSKAAAEAGANALLHVTPYYNKTSQQGLIRHFTAVADATDLPVILYNVPSRTGVNIAPQTCRILADHPNIAALKEASGNLSQAAETAQLCGDDLTIYSGNDDQILPLLSIGAKGVISVLSNLLPKETHQLCQLCLDGNLEESRRLQLKLLPLIHALFSDVNPIPIKEAMKLTGFDCGPCRLPLVEMSPEGKENLRNRLQEAGLL